MKYRISTVATLCVVIANLYFIDGSSVDAAVPLRKVVMTGDPAMGVGADVIYRLPGAPVINDAGQVAFHSSLFGPGVNSQVGNGQGIWVEDSGVFRLIARTGNQAAGAGPGVVFNDLEVNTPILNASGEVAFMARLRGPATNTSNELGIWAGAPNDLNLVARKGDMAEGTSVNYGEYDNLVFNDQGQVAFQSELLGPGVDTTNNSGVWAGDQGTLGLAARIGDPVPGIDAVFTEIKAPLLNGLGQTLIGALIAGPEANSTNDSGLWMHDSGALTTILRTGDPAPGTSVTYTRFKVYALNGEGHIAVSADLSGVRDGTTSGIWEGIPDSLRLAVRQGDFVPGFGENANIEGLFYFSLAESGDVLFRPQVSNIDSIPQNGVGIFTGPKDDYRLLARPGVPAPGTDAEFRYPSFGADSVLSTNNQGQIAFWSLLQGPNVNQTNDQGVWATDPTGEIQLVLRAGDVLDVNDDPLIEDYRTVDFVGNVAGTAAEDGRARSFNDSGELALLVGFTDGSRGVYVATIPEPGMLLIVGAGACLIGRIKSHN